jgi:hypothetical protein
MKINKFALTAVLISIFCLNAEASSWFGFTHAWNDGTSAYFDKDTIVKVNGNITLWIKWVQDPTSIAKDGVYSYAQKVTYFCKNNQYQNLFESHYNRSNQFIQSFPKAQDVKELIPDSLGDSIRQTVCAPTFPNTIPTDAAYKVNDNNIIEDARIFYEKRAASKNDPAPK